MPISVDPVTHIIHIPLADLTLVQAGLYDFDTNQFRLDLRAWEATEEGRAEPLTHIHSPAFTVAGETSAPGFKLINDYSVEFEDGNHSVRLKNTNNNLFDIADGRLIKNNVLVIPGNSFGLSQVTVNTGSVVTSQNITDIANAVKAILAGDFSAVPPAVWAETMVDVNSQTRTMESMLFALQFYVQETFFSLPPSDANNVPFGQIFDIWNALGLDPLSQPTVNPDGSFTMNRSPSSKPGVFDPTMVNTHLRDIRIALATQLTHVINLLEADEYHTQGNIIKKLRKTQTELLRKNVTGSNFTGNMEIKDP